VIVEDSLGLRPDDAGEAEELEELVRTDGRELWEEGDCK